MQKQTKNYHQIYLMFWFIFLLSVMGFAQQYFTPDAQINKQLQSDDLNVLSFFGVSKTADGLVINPSLKEGWTWLAAKDLPYNDEHLSFFFVDGWLFTNKSIVTAHRRQKYQRNVTDLIKSNVFTLAFYKEKAIEKELCIFIASETDIQARLVIDKKLWGEEKEIVYNLIAGEGHLISVLKTPDEYQPLFYPNEKAARKTILLNKDWKFIRQDVANGYKTDYSDSDWQNVSIPHCWNAQDVVDTRNFNDGFEIYQAYYRGPGWYRKQFLFDASLKDKKIFLEFEGANQVAEAWLNDRYLGKHIGGYTGFSFDITNDIRPGKNNILAVRVDNSYNYDIPPHTADFIMYGGLYRDVRLVIKDKLFVNDLAVVVPEVDLILAKTKTRTMVRNANKEKKDITLITNIVNEQGEIVVSDLISAVLDAESSLKLESELPEFKNPHLWSPEDPYLYTVYSTLFSVGQPVDEVKSSIGYRWYSFDADSGFYLNGKSLKLKGVNKHQDYQGLGNAVSDSLQVRDIEIIKEMGANFIRLSHYPHDPSVLTACDKLGMLVWEEIPLVNTVGGEKFAENTKQMMREMIGRDKNHPSVILWGITNESAMPFTNAEQVPRIKKLLQDLHKIAKEMDPSRLTAQAHNHFKDISLAGITDVIGRNRYFGWYQGGLKDFDQALDDERVAHPDWKVLISEYGVGSRRGYHVDDPVAWDFSEEYQLDYHEHYLQAINQRPWIAGSLVWNMFDFGSFVKVGNIPRVNQKGLCDFSRHPKDAYYFYQSQWAEEPMVYIVSHTRRFYAGLKNDTKRIRVYSNCDSVELFLNGISLGERKKQYVYHWDVSFNAGENILRAVAHKGNNHIEDKIMITCMLTEE